MKFKVALVSVVILFYCTWLALAGDPTLSLDVDVSESYGHQIVPVLGESPVPLSALGYDVYSLRLPPPAPPPPAVEEKAPDKKTVEPKLDPEETERLREWIARDNKLEEGKDVQIEMVAPRKVKRGEKFEVKVTIKKAEKSKFAGKMILFTVESVVGRSQSHSERWIPVKLSNELQPSTTFNCTYTPDKIADYIIRVGVMSSLDKPTNYSHSILILSRE